VREENNDPTVQLSNNIAAIRKALYMGIIPLEDSTFESNVVHLSKPHPPWCLSSCSKRCCSYFANKMVKTTGE